MKRIFIFSMLAICLCYSCQQEELTGDDDKRALEVPEYFSAKINGVEFILTDPNEIGGTVYPDPESKVNTFSFWGAQEIRYHSEAIVFKICFYNGPGTYYTGDPDNINYADYLVNLDVWHNDYRLGDPGEVIITEANDTFVEGTFAFNAFNYETYDLVNIEGRFGVALEENSNGY